jgi:hypothetical protein
MDQTEHNEFNHFGDNNKEFVPSTKEQIEEENQPKKAEQDEGKQNKSNLEDEKESEDAKDVKEEENEKQVLTINTSEPLAQQNEEKDPSIQLSNEINSTKNQKKEDYVRQVLDEEFPSVMEKVTQLNSATNEDKEPYKTLYEARDILVSSFFPLTCFFLLLY